MTWDHVVPRDSGGDDSASNLQPMCLSHNSSKGARPDAYWSQYFYWDQTPDLNKCRFAQRERVYNVVYEQKDWLLRPISEISRILYTLVFVMGAGKTFCAPAFAFAYNRLHREYRPVGAPRIDKILYLAKDRSIRDQVAESFEKDLVQYGICTSSPRVGVVKDGGKLNDPNWVSQFDIIVACVHQLWEQDGKPRTNLAKVLAQFPLIVVDENHFALKQVMQIVQVAECSLVLGLTGSPMEADGSTINQLVLFSEYDLQEAYVYDKGLKYISSELSELPQFFRVVDIKDHGADVLEDGLVRQATSAAEKDYDKNFRPVMGVAIAVADELRTRDQINGLHIVDGEVRFTREVGALAPHRRTVPDARADHFFPQMGLIQVESITYAKAAARALNDYFEANRAQFPMEHGWIADYVVCDEVNLPSEERGAPRPLTPDHPWFLYKKSKRLERGAGRDKEYACRVLFTVAIGREGVDNPYCGVVGLARKTKSLIYLIQGTLGRNLRSPFEVDAEGVHHFPPSEADQILTITHATFRLTDGNDNPGQEPLVRAINLVCNMREITENMLRVEDLERGQTIADPADLDPDAFLTTDEKTRFVGVLDEEVRRASAEGRSPNIEAAVRDFISTLAARGPSRVQAARDFARRVLADPDRTRQSLNLTPALQPRLHVLEERITREITMEDLELHIRSTTPESEVAEGMIRLLRDSTDSSCAGWPVYKKTLSDVQAKVRATHSLRLKPVTTLSDIRQKFHRNVRSGLTRAGYPGNSDDQLIFQLCNRAINIVLGVPSGQGARRNSVYDRPECHAMLERGDIQREMSGWVRMQLIRRGLWPSLARRCGVVVDGGGHGPSGVDNE